MWLYLRPARSCLQYCTALSAITDKREIGKIIITFLFSLSKGLTRVHVVGHSLGGKVAAVAALHLAEEERLKKSRGSDLDTAAKGDDNDSDSDKERIIEIMSLTLIDVSPVDYADDEAFGEVFRTLDIVEVLNDQLPSIGTEPLSVDSTSTSGGERERGRERAADRAGPQARNMLSNLLGGRVEDPMLKAFLLASIQPIDERNKIGAKEGDLGGLGSSIRDVMNKIQSTKELLHAHRVGRGQLSGEAESDSNSDSNSRASGAGSGSMGGFEWKFSVEGIARFRNQLGGWPTRYSNDDDDDDDDGDDSAEAEAVAGAGIKSDLRAAGKNDQRKRIRAVDILAEEKEGETVRVRETVTPYTNPVLVMKGALSKFVKSSHIAPIASLFPLFTLLTVRDAGHWLHFEKPKESSESLVKFIRRVEDRHREINSKKT